MGPIALFDKSFLQSISTDEAVWFDHFFMPIVCPVFHVETLGNLAKQSTQRTPEAAVRDLANKFPEWSGSPCEFHADLAIADLLGQHIELRYQIPRPGGRPVQSGTIFDRTPVEQAFARWRKGEFCQLEQLAASLWRKALGELDLVSVQKEMRSLGFTPKACRTLQEAKAIADALVNGKEKPYSRLALATQFFHVPQHLHQPITRAWQNSGARTLAEFAPYAAYALSVELFFQIALGAGLIGGERPSNRSDIAYLFYLPFAMIFVSSDDLHRRTAPLFMRTDQAFVWGIDLKAALSSINEHFLRLPLEEREKGISAFAHSPPDGNLVAELWDRFLRKGYRDELPVEMSPEEHAELLKRLKEFTKRQTLQGGVDAEKEDEMIAVEREVRQKRGSGWQLAKDASGKPQTTA
jgi:hypothetical protein